MRVRRQQGIEIILVAVVVGKEVIGIGTTGDGGGADAVAYRRRSSGHCNDNVRFK